MKKIIPALALLLISAMVLASASYAWFSMNNSVTATGMQVVAKAESGLLISADKTEASWAYTDATTYNTAVALAPTSTSDLTNWYHNVSNAADTYAASGTYQKLTENGTSSDTVLRVLKKNLATEPAVAQVVYADGNNNGNYAPADDTAYYLQTSFFIKSSGDEIVIDQTKKWLAVQTIALSGITNSAALDASLRIGVKIGNAVVIMAPLAAAQGTGTASGTITYTVNSSASTSAYKGTIASSGNYEANLNTGWTGTIPSKTAENPLTVDIFLWFEGEDVNCKSNNIVTNLDALTIDVEFGLVESAPTNVAS